MNNYDNQISNVVLLNEYHLVYLDMLDQNIICRLLRLVLGLRGPGVSNSMLLLLLELFELDMVQLQAN